MNLSEKGFFKFSFEIDGVKYNFDVISETKTAAVNQIKQHMTQILAEINMDFPSDKNKK